MSESPIQSHRDLKVWQVGMQIAEDVYAVTQAYPSDERFGLVSQMRRAAISVPANVAEGNGRESTKEYLRFLAIAVGSLAELETFLELSTRLNLSKRESLRALGDLIAEERRMLRGLQRSLRSRLSQP